MKEILKFGPLLAACLPVTYALCRVGNVFGMHYALDGESWKMVRVFQLPVPGSIRVGLVAQCPAGPGAEIDFLHFSVEARTVQSLRAGI